MNIFTSANVTMYFEFCPSLPPIFGIRVVTLLFPRSGIRLNRPAGRGRGQRGRPRENVELQGEIQRLQA